MQSIWSKQNLPGRPGLEGDMRVDALVIGGGMAGVLCAYRLTQAGVGCALVEGGRICGGNTANTTAKITAQHDILYQKLIKRFGREAARKYYVINSAAIDEYKALSQSISCDLEHKTAYVYSREERKMLEDEANAYDALDIPFQWRQDAPLPFPVAGALGMPRQAQFHPLKLIDGLLPHIQYFENTFIHTIDGNRALYDGGAITAGHIILATHFPLVNIPGLYFLKLTQSRSYVLALQGEGIDDMYIDCQQGGYSFRAYGDMLLLGGGGHKTGKTGGGWQQLRGFSRHAYPQAKAVYNWSAQDCMTLDGIPYIGRHRVSANNLYVATGFNKWGMTSSMAAAMVLTDIITLGSSEYEKLFSPGRTMLRPALISNIASAAIGLLRPGKRCKHMGCSLKWNDEEKSWDCPCHGSRFSLDGSILDNPAKREL